MNYRINERKIIGTLALLLITIQVSSLIMLHHANREIARDNLEQDLNTGSQVFTRLLESRHQQLDEAVRVLAADYGFKETIATGEKATIESMLDNHGNRIQASMVILSDLDHHIIAQAPHGPFLTEGEMLPQPAPFYLSNSEDAASENTRLGHAIPENVGPESERQDGQLSARFIPIGKNIYQLVDIPVLAPTPIARLSMGFSVDNNLAQELTSISGMRVTFLSRKRDSKQWQEHGSTLIDFGDNLFQNLDPTDKAPQEISRGGETWLAITLPLMQTDSSEIVAVLGKSMNEAMAPFHKLETVMLYLIVASILIAIFCIAYITRRMVGPINALAHLDGLTGLANRRLLNLSLEQAIADYDRTEMPFSVLIMDLDRFKVVNDMLGHDVGDQVLQYVARRLRSNLRKTDTIARMGGDEFSVLLPGADRETACAITHKIIHALEEPINISGQNIDVGISIGIAVAPDDGRDPRVLLRLADRAMYMAKHSKTGFNFYTPDADGFEPEELTLLGELRRGFSQGELEVHYQPIIGLDSMTPVGAEALLRWRRPGRGLVPPMEFIPFAEKTGFMRTLTHWVLEEGLSECARWRDHGHNLYLSVNITPQDLLDETLPSYIEGLLQERNLNPELLCIEITERGFLNYSAKGLDMMQSLRKIGVHLAVDDFGTGYSSLAYVRQLPVTHLKIDRLFTSNLDGGESDFAIVLSTVELGRRLGLLVTAEGIEDQATADVLHETGCHYAQGYYFCPPMHPVDMSRWFEDTKKHSGKAYPPSIIEEEGKLQSL